MSSRLKRPDALIYAGILLVGCEHEQPLAPATEAPISEARASNLGAPSNLAANAIATNRVRLTWQDNSTNENGFEVLRSLTGLPGSFASHAETAAGVVIYDDGSVEPSTRYCYAVRSFKIAARKKSYSELSSSACATMPVPPGAPPGPTGTAAFSANSSTVTVTWADNSADEAGFRVERAGSVAGPWEPAATTGPDLISLSDDARSSETQVCYRVAAFNGNGQSMWSEETACAIPPAGPTDLRAVGADQTTIDLTWLDNSAVEQGYEIQRATAADGPYTVIANLPANVTSYRDLGLASNQSYWYRVRAERTRGFSDFSTPAATVLATSPPAAPTWVSASPMNGTWTDIIWRDNSTNEAGIRIERSEAGGPWDTIVSGGPQTEEISFLRDGHQYPIETEICYRIIAFNGLGESSVTGCTALPALAIDLTAKVVDGAVELTWSDVSRFEDGFYIVRADGISMGFYYVYDAAGANATTYRDVNPDPEWSSYYLRGMKGPEGYSCCSNAVDVFMPPAPE